VAHDAHFGTAMGAVGQRASFGGLDFQRSLIIFEIMEY
jgi:hypothetical protein